MMCLTNRWLLLVFGLAVGAGCSAPRQQEAAAPPEEAEPVEIVDAGPQIVRIIQPEYPRAARGKDVRATIVVNVWIDEQGVVREAAVVQSYLLGEDASDKQPVPEVGYGLEEAAVEAAKQWLFRPAYQNGQPIPSNHAVTFNFGF